ncbi:MAG: hypothetical protein AAFZ58_08270 [Pseudomonadota bacterium]
MRVWNSSLAKFAVVVATLAAANAHAAGVAAGDVVENLATVSYSVNGVAQTAIESSPTGNSTPGAGNGAVTDFTVDRVIDLTLIQQGTVNTLSSPGALQQVTTFVLTNDSNAAQGYTFAAADLATGTAVNTGPADSIDLGTYNVFVDDGSGVFEPATDTATTVTSLAADASVVVFVLADIPLTAVDGDVANVELTATTVEPGTATSPTNSAANAEDGPADTLIRNLTAAARDGYQVEAAALAITKSQTTISDGISAAAPFFNIPGAVIRYTVTIDNTGSQDAGAVSITDTIVAELDISGSTTVTIDNDGAVTTCTVDVGDADVDGCGRVDNDGGTPADPSDDTSDLTINPGIAVLAGTQATVSFDVTIR